jgi:hypothetical protein
MKTQFSETQQLTNQIHSVSRKSCEVLPSTTSNSHRTHQAKKPASPRDTPPTITNYGGEGGGGCPPNKCPLPIAVVRFPYPKPPISRTLPQASTQCRIQRPKKTQNRTLTPLEKLQSFSFPLSWACVLVLYCRAHPTNFLTRYLPYQSNTTVVPSVKHTSSTLSCI